MLPDWLSPPLEISGANIEETYQKLYEVYLKIVSELDTIVVDGKHVVFDRNPDAVMPQFEGAFMHFVTRGAGSVRVYDEARASKIHWIVPLLKHYEDEDVKSFWCQGPKVNTLYIWLEEYNYVLILKDMKSAKFSETRMVVTAFSVDSDYRKSLRKKYQRAKKIL